MAAACLVFAGLIGVPYLAGRLLWRVKMPLPVRVSVILAFPAVLVWWLGTSPDFHDITEPGAVLIPLTVIAGWLSGTTRPLRRKLSAIAGGDPQPKT